MRNVRSKCIAAVASVVMTAVTFLSVGPAAQSAGLPSWVKVTESSLMAAAREAAIVHRPA